MEHSSAVAQRAVLLEDPLSLELLKRAALALDSGPLLRSRNAEKIQ